MTTFSYFLLHVAISVACLFIGYRCGHCGRQDELDEARWWADEFRKRAEFWAEKFWGLARYLKENEGRLRGRGRTRGNAADDIHAADWWKSEEGRRQHELEEEEEE